ncbi:MAG: septum formation family protein [Actinomycetota bacterium]|nr:septum formation family protein [Actinomycetota bacterium]
MTFVVALATAGFAMSFAGPVPSPASVGAPRPGACHLAEDPTELLGIPSDSAPPVPCHEPHQTETMFLTKVTGVAAAAKLRPNGELLNKLAGHLCYNYRLERSYVGAGPSDVTYGIYSWFRFPTAAAWARGDRTVDCQGSTQPETPNGPTIAYPLAGVMTSSHSAVFRLCRTTTGDVTCNLPHQAEDTSPNVVLPSGPYPGPAKVDKLEQLACRPIATAYLGQPIAWRPDLVLTPDPITEAAWTAGNRSTECWLDNAGATMTTGTVRRVPG